MSEYQFYEFRCLDKQLSEKDLAHLRKISSRAEITPTSFTNTYTYGDFKGNPRQLVALYFDAFVYVTNWGHRQLIFKFPQLLVTEPSFKPYGNSDNLKSLGLGQFTLLEFDLNMEESDWEEGEGWLSRLIGIRSDIIQQDYRALYLGWLAGFVDETLALDEIEPPVPAGLKNLNDRLSCLCEFLRLPPNLILAAASNSHEIPLEKEHQKDQREWIKDLPKSAKDNLLFNLLNTGDSFIGAELRRKYAESCHHKDSHEGAQVPRRTVRELREEARLDG